MTLNGNGVYLAAEADTGAVGMLSVVSDMFRIAAASENEYRFTAVDCGVYTKGLGKDLQFTVNGPKDECTGVKIDGTLIDASSYTLASGSTIITLRNTYLETLSAGDHDIAAVYGDREAKAGFKVAAASQGSGTTAGSSSSGTGQTASPKTGDSSRTVTWITLLFISFGGILTACFSWARKNRSK